MKKKKFKVFPFVTALFLLFSLVYVTSTPVMAEDTNTFGDFQYTIDAGNRAVITKYTGNDEILTIPSTLEGRAVVQIQDNAFADNDTLKEVNIPDTVVVIGYTSFSDCDNLEKITVNNAYYTNEDGVLFDKNKEFLMKYPPKKNDTSYIIPNSVRIIVGAAFANCSNLTKITIPSNVTNINYATFMNCINLSDITIPYGITKIDVSAFDNCSSLTNITIPDSVTYIGISAFYNCTSLENITIPDNVTYIGEAAFFKCSSLTNITIPYGVTNIYSQTFYFCSSLTDVEIKSSLTKIDNSAFVGGISISNIIIHKDTNDNSSEKNITVNGFPITIKLDIPTKIGIGAIKNGNATLADYEIAGFTGGNTNNLDSINAAITNSKNQMINLTQNEIRDFIQNKIIIINNIIINNNVPTTTPSAVIIKGTERVGKTLEAVLLTDSGAKFTTSAGVTYDWYRLSSENDTNGVSVGDGETYRLLSADKGKYIKVVVAYDGDIFEKVTGRIGKRSSSGSSSSGSSSTSSEETNSSNASDTPKGAKQSGNSATSAQIPNGWQKQSDGTWKYGEHGQAVIGWKKVNDIWYSFASDGIMEKGFKQEGGITYYLDNEGAMETGWELVNGSWYLFDNSGAMLTGWQQVDGKWYYLNPTGAMATGWISIEGKWYYLYGDGSMAVSTVINGYTVDENGVWIA